MIRCLLTEVTRNRSGSLASRKIVITADSIQIGREAACNIFLRDHRVNLLHANVMQLEDGKLYIEGEGGAVIRVNGFIEQRAELAPGASIGIGPYLLTVDPASNGYDIALSVELVEAPSERDVAEPVKGSLATMSTLGLSYHKLGFGLAFFILFVFVLLPMLPSASSALDEWQASLPVTLTDSWSPGQLSNGHVVFGAQCSICHQRPFRAVSDDACMGCHTQTPKHLASGDPDVRAFASLRCVSCHLEHKGKAGLMRPEASSCIACHRDIRSIFATSLLANVSDFDADHPPFHITLWDGKVANRVWQEDGRELTETSGLKFSHKVHLVKNGVASPEGDTVLTCRDCHKLEQSGIHFSPMTMRKTCQQSRCHEMYYDVPGKGVVPHGSEREVMMSLREAYAKSLAETSIRNIASCRHLAGTEGPVKRTLECANELAQNNAAESMFKENQDSLACGKCHETILSQDKSVPWKVAQLHINRNWQPYSVFPHSKHATANCSECHEKLNSTSSAEISLPTIDKCRECHVGKYPKKGKVSSFCDSCHRFHLAKRS